MSIPILRMCSSACESLNNVSRIRYSALEGLRSYTNINEFACEIPIWHLD